MAKWPIIEYKRDGQTVTLKLPADTDLWQFLAWMDKNFLGITDEKMAEIRRVDAVVETQRSKSRKVKK